MEQQLDAILERYATAKETATRELQELLTARTAQVLERKGSFQQVSYRLNRVAYTSIPRDLVLDHEMEAFRPSRSNGSVSGYSHAILRRDGRLYELLVIGEDDDGSWVYAGEVRGELKPDEYLGLAPHFIRTLDGLITGMEQPK